MVGKMIKNYSNPLQFDTVVYLILFLQIISKNRMPPI